MAEAQTTDIPADDDFIEMTTTELREIIARLEWSQIQLARIACRGRANTHKMARGRHPIDRPLAVWLRSLDAIITAPPIRHRKPDHAEDTAPDPEDAEDG